jgi:hypothetical protein
MRLPGVGFKSHPSCRGWEPIAIEHERQEASAAILCADRNRAAKAAAPELKE